MTKSPVVGSLPQSKQLDFVLTLPLRNRDTLTNLLQELYDPASPNFHRFLTAQEFAEKFGPTEQDYDALVDFAKINGFKIVGLHPNRTLLDVRGATADVEKALHIKFQLRQHPTENRKFYAPDTDPSFDFPVPLLEIHGLDDFAMPHPLHHEAKLPAQTATPAAGSGPSGLYIGTDFRKAYIPGVSLDGAGQSVGLFELDGYYTNDPVRYASAAGLTNAFSITNVPIDGLATISTNNVEVALDIEMVMSMAPAARIIVYEGPNTAPALLDVLNRMANDNLAKQLSASWYYPTSPSVIQAYQQMAAQGQTFFNSSGDYDALTSNIPGSADDPYITIVGGTTLTTDAAHSWLSEKVWNWGNGTGSSGGISKTWPIPTWQQGINMAANGGSTSMRNFPDVAMIGDQVYAIADNGVAHSLGGTSVSAPLWAAFAALVNQKALSQGKPVIGFINPAIYQIAKGSGYSLAFHDVTTGSNTNSSSPTKFFAATGYDLCTGIGTPKANLIDALLNNGSGPAQGWTQTSLPALNWSCAASSADGTRLIVGASSGNIYTSSTGGATWLAGPSGDWRGVASSADGSHLAAASWKGPIYTSSDFGATWAASTAPNYSWQSLASSADGSKLVVGAASEKIVEISTDNGASWQSLLGAPVGNSMPVGWSGNGSTLITASGNQVYVSTNLGTSFFLRTILGVTLHGVAASADGSRLFAAGSSIICTSTNFGNTWHTTPAPQKGWSAITCSADGFRVAATSFEGLTYASQDGGGTWANISPSAGTSQVGGTCIASSDDGDRLLAGLNVTYLPGKVFTGYFPAPPTIVIQPSSLTAQCGLDAVFKVRASGSYPLTYRWYSGSTPLADVSGVVGSTSSNLVLKTVSLSQGGSAYSVVVSNTNGTATSQTAYLSVQETNPPIFQSLTMTTNGVISATLGGLAGQTYIEQSSDLIHWTPLTSVILTNSGVRFSDTISTNSPRRFYRARVN